MTVHLERGAAEQCVNACTNFVSSVDGAARREFVASQESSLEGFETARQIGTVYSLFAERDLGQLLDGFAYQAEAMSMLFAAAGGLIDAQDEAVAAALGKATQEAPAMQSLGLMGSIGSLTSMIDAAEAGAPTYSRVGPEDVSGTPLERIVAGARALDESQFQTVKTHVNDVADVLDSAAEELRADLTSILGSQWQGEFAASATAPIDGLTRSAFGLAAALRQVGVKADGAESGFGRTRENISAEADALQSLQQVSAVEQGPGTTSLGARTAAERAAAEEQARATMNTVYSPAVMDANLDDLDFPTAYRVLSSGALGGPNGVDMASIWNDEGVIRPAVAGTPSPSAIAATGGTGTGDAGIRGGGPPGGSGGASLPVGGGAAPSDAATEQALLAARGAGADMAGPGAGPAAGATGGSGGPGGGGVNAGTAAAAAGTPTMAPGTPRAAGAPGRNAGGGRGAGSVGERGPGASAGSGAGQSGGTAGSRMGGAGSLSGIGASGPGAPGHGPAGGRAAVAPGAGRAGMPAAGVSGSGVAGGRMGAMPMGMMGGAGAGQGNRSEGHRPASYLVNATNTSEILGKPVKVSPARIGARPPVEPGVDETAALAGKPETTNADRASSATVSPAQALVNKLRGR